MKIAALTMKLVLKLRENRYVTTKMNSAVKDACNSLSFVMNDSSCPTCGARVDAEVAFECLACCSSSTLINFFGGLPHEDIFLFEFWGDVGLLVNFRTDLITVQNNF